MHDQHIPSQSSPDAGADTLGVHGMLIFGGWRNETGFGGRSGVYASHLPMFMAPHDFQVIMRVTGDAAGRYSEFVAHFGDFQTYTFKPQPFPIDELDPAGGGPARRSVVGSLFRGHFERGGTEIATEVALEVEQVVYFSRLAVTERPGPGQLRYICFGERDATLLAHRITTPPDFDQILTAGLGSLSNVSDDDLRAGVILTVPDRSDSAEARLREAQTAQGTVWPAGAQNAEPVQLTVSQEVYVETGDLATAM